MKSISFKIRSIIVLCASIFLIDFSSCERDDETYELNNPEGIALRSIIYFKDLSLISLEADGTTQTFITIQINPEASSDYRQIVLTTTVGAFSNRRQTDTIVANASGIASFPLSSSIVGLANIRATVKSVYSIDTVVSFEAALPQDLLVTADKYNVKTDQPIEVTTALSRDPNMGMVSDPIKVYYFIIPDSSQSGSLIYPAFAYSSQSKSTITITNPFLLTGKFTLEVTTISSIGTTLKKDISFFYEN
jgi:hypothetical protein